MKKIFTSTFIFLCLSSAAFAQQPVVWPIIGNSTAPSSSWAAIGYDASSSVAEGIWKLYQPKQVAAEATKVVYIQYNPGRLVSTDPSTTHSNIVTDMSQLRYLIINLKNHTAQTKLRFYYRFNNNGVEAWKFYDFDITANDVAFKDYVIDLSTLPNWSDYAKMPLIRFDFIQPIPVYVAPAVPDLLLEVDYIGFSNTTTLPVSLNALSGKKGTNGILLKWETESESNNSHFDILRSADGKVFQKISSVTGSGTSSEPRSYNFLDENPLPEINYYQLEQVDFNGVTSKSWIIAVNSGLKRVSLSVYNEADNAIKVSAFSTVNSAGTLFVTDMTGTKVFENSYDLISGQNILTVRSLASGLYVATLTISEGKVSTKFVVQ